MTVDDMIPPLRDLVGGRLNARKEHLIAESARSGGRPTVVVRRPIVAHRRVVVAALALGFLLIGTAVAATTDWLTGSPAPKSVVSDFGSYPPQLGFNPEAGHAVQVAADDDAVLYATTNKEGSYCMIASVPWKRPATLPDGGTCVAKEQAEARLVAGLVAASNAPDGQQTYVIAGRAADPGARAIGFSDPSGGAITRPLGSSGFFIAVIRSAVPACVNGDWEPTFYVVGADGGERRSATITLGAAPPGSSGACVFAAPHA